MGGARRLGGAGATAAPRRRHSAGRGPALLAGLLIGAVPTGLEAQGTPQEQICLPSLVDAEATRNTFAGPPYWAARYPGNVAEELAVFEAEGDWLASARRLQEMLEADGGLFEGSPAAPVHQRLLDEVAALVEALESSRETVLAEGVPGAAVFLVDQNPVTGQILLLNQSAALAPDLSLDQTRSLCWGATNAWRFTERLGEGARRELEAELWARVERWRVFNERGLTPWPWELAVNEAVNWLGSREALEPPRAQVVLLRPLLAVDVDWDLGARDNLWALEVAGVIRYINDRRWYVGASFLWASPDEGADAGFGALIHLTPWFKGGPLWRDVDGDGDRDARLFLSLDFYDLLVGPPTELVRGLQAAAAGRDPEGR